MAWEQRWHPLRGEWVLFTSHRAARPWNGEAVTIAARPPAYDPTCYLCPGNERVGGARNPMYDGVWWFTNDLPCFSADAPAAASDDDVYRRRSAAGTAEVVCYHPDHGRTFGELSADQSTAVIDTWCERSAALGRRPDSSSVLVFENRGATVGTSNPHPHGQIYAGDLVYGVFDREDRVAVEHAERTGRSLLLDVLAREADGARQVAANDSFVACIPWFARYAYEVLILPRRPVASLPMLGATERQDLAAVLLEVVRGYDRMWDITMPFVLAVHQAPTDGRPTDHFPCHVEIHPPLRRVDTLKYLAGPEIGGGTMTNESDPDEKAAELRAAVDAAKQAV